MAKNSTIYALLTAFGVLTASFKADACTNIIVTRGASTDNSNIISYAADSHVLDGELYFHPAADWKAGSMLDIINWDSYKPMGQIPQIAHTYKTVGNMNEHQLIIAETTWGGRLELEDTTAIMDYGSFIYVALQRARTAREAIQVIVDLANEYGYASEGETFSIADKDEAWIMDLIGKGCEMKDGKNIRKGFVWVAMRIPDGYICSHANQARIQTFPLNDPENCLYAPDVISFRERERLLRRQGRGLRLQRGLLPGRFRNRQRLRRKSLERLQHPLRRPVHLRKGRQDHHRAGLGLL